MSLKSFIKKITDWFSKLFKSLLPEARQAVHVGVTVTEALHKFDTDNPVVADILTAIIPGTLDDKIAAALRSKLPEIVVHLKLVDATLGLTDPAEIVEAAVKALKQLSGDYKSAFLNSLAIIIAQVAADGKLDWNDAAYLVKWYHDHKDNDAVDTTL